MCAAQVTRDILSVGDVWAVDMEPLELQNAETKRTATTGGSRRLECTAAGKTVVGLREGQQGPLRITERKEYSTSMALSTMNNLLVTQKLRRGDGPFQYPQSRKAERLFGVEGRTKRKSTRIKLELIGREYEPSKDTCIKAMVRLMAQAALQTDAESTVEATE